MIIFQKGNTIASGRLVKDARFRTAGAKHYHFCDFSIPAAETTGDDGQKKTTWVNVSCSFELADKARNLHKGDRVLVCGTMSTRSYVKDGVEKTATELQADFLAILDKARSVDDLASDFPGVVSDSPIDSAFAEIAGGDGELPF